MASAQTTIELPGPVSFLDAFIYWLKLGFISFGGAAGQISMIHQELVEKRRGISEHRFLHALNYTVVLPGPEAQQLATYIGWLMHGVWGGIMAGVLFVLPSLFILIGLTWVYLVYGDVPAVEGILYGIKPAVTAIVVFAAYRIGSRALNNHILRVMAVLAFIAIFALDIPFPYIVLMAGTIVYAGSHFAPDSLLVTGVAGACVATLFTLLPSFLFILLGGPAVEATRGDIKFTAPLTGITAAVVGVVLNLAVFLAYHVLWPEGFDARFEWFSALIGAAAFVALFKFKIGIVPVIGACAAVGLTYSLLM